MSQYFGLWQTGVCPQTSATLLFASSESRWPVMIMPFDGQVPSDRYHTAKVWKSACFNERCDTRPLLVLRTASRSELWRRVGLPKVPSAN